ncbi:hypothetical protein GGR92_005248 [Spirosoma lacussanchae]|uniref:hypothetical protein n=1 Tax=Spirosoma lacussanchae TaxID=1884249 RepID=UPI00110817DC|nr:hypothetical protein [Spirosoma lacussanchae]
MTTDIELHDTEVVDNEQIHDAVLVLDAPALAPISFALTLEEIDKVAAEASKLTIADHNDRAGYKAVYSFRQMVKDQRIGVEKRQKELKRPHIDYNRSVDQLAKQLVDPMKVIEEGLSKQEAVYEAEQERIKREAEQAEALKRASRIESVIRLGGILNEAAYDVFGTRVDLVEIETLPDDKWGEIYATLEEAYTCEQIRLAEIERERQEEQARLEQQRIEQEAQAKRLADQAAEIERREQELARLEADAKRKEQERERQAEQDRLAALLAYRVPMMETKGFEKNSRGFYVFRNTDWWFDATKIATLSDEQFADLIASAESMDRQRHREQVSERRSSILYGLGFTLENERYLHPTAELTEEGVCDLSDADFDKVVKLAGTHNKKADRARIERLKKEKKAFADYLRVYQSGSTVGFYEQPEIADLLDRFTGAIRQVIEAYRAELNAL